MTVQRWQVYAVLAIGLFALGLGTGLGLGARHDGKKAQAAQTQADQQEGAALGHAADAQATHAQGQTQAVAVATADRKVAVARKALAEVQPIPPVPAVTDTGDKLVITRQNTLIESLTQDNAALKLEASLAHVEADQWHKAYGDSQKAYGGLQKAIRPIPKWAAGVSYNPADHTYGGWVERDMTRFRVGVDILQERTSIQAGGGTSIQALVRVGFSWGSR